MATPDHPLTETRAAELWSTASNLPWMGLPALHRPGTVAAMQAAYDAGRADAPKPADPHHDPRPWQDCTRDDIRKGDMVEARDCDLLRTGVAHHTNVNGNWFTEDGWRLTWGDLWPLRRIPATPTEEETTMTETTPSEPLARTLFAVPEGHGAPHHDADAIRTGDFVVQVDHDGFIHAGIAHHQDSEGDWLTEDGQITTWAKFRADHPDAITVWPAPTPPAEEVELPTEHPAHITDVKGSNDANGAVCAYMAINRFGTWHGVDRGGEYRAWPPRWIAAFTLPDGTRARRDGVNEDGAPRFVKDREEK